ncbi:MAG: sigma-70 family RNA polymerase sigma factor [Armatimonadetes bacterium]|nr:sigma-70 family RNA polymerase sigma factor [Armatimonadota bacterium]MBX3107683.1 sigma-70 family RNA polymerase sigma factor [Fimbriimonadaceae bacterium]
MDAARLLDENDSLVWGKPMEDYVRRAVRTWCHRLGIRGEDVKDLEQDAVMSAWERVGNGKVRYQEGLWFLARNTVLDHRARMGRQQTVPLTEDLVCPQPDPLTGLTIDEITREFPELVMLARARVDGFEWELIAQSLGVSCGTLRVRYSRMVKRASAHFGVGLDELLAGR